MTITLLMRGGLGNQMFQYAAARSLALRHDAALVVDLRFYANARKGSSKSVWLTAFPLSAKVVDYAGAWLGPHHPVRRVVRQLVTERRGGARVYREPRLAFDQGFLDVRDGAVVVGEFNSPRYFAGHWVDIAPEFDVTRTGVSVADEFNGIPLDEFVAVHVRRGDYVGNPDFELIGAEHYYCSALAQARALGFSKVLIFSDDIAYCEGLDIFGGARSYVGAPEDPPYRDLFAMSRCGGVITANSTFSWWAGWFASRRGAPVFAPALWVGGRKAREMDILPPEWIEVPCS